ncbi:MAG: hypothetical protein E7158_01195 [Firmicutes bacterium]|nr:hypothetical protein [Bacillota bacterium]
MLNKNGWGFRSYIIGSSILLLFLLIITFHIISLYNGFANTEGEAIDSFYYQDLEGTLDDVSMEYINRFYNRDITTGVVTISTSKLIDKGLIDKEDLKVSGDKCKGYSVVKKNEDNLLVSESFIKCKNYVTSGYQSWRIE